MQARSEGFNLERKAETGEMWLLVRGRGGEVDISVEAKNLESLQRKNGRAKCHQTRSLIQSGLWTIAVAPSRVSRMRTILRRCSKIFCAASHTVGYNKLCGIYLIFHLELNYIMRSQWPWTVFELLDLLSAVNMQLYVCRKKVGIVQGSFGHFYMVTWFSRHFRCIIQN